MYRAHFVHLLVDGCLGSFRLLAVGNSASVTINTSSSPCFQFFGYPHLKIKSQNYFFQNLFLKAHCQLDAIIRQLLSCVRLCDPMDCSTPGFPVLCCLLEFAQTQVILSPLYTVCFPDREDIREGLLGSQGQGASRMQLGGGTRERGVRGQSWE